MMEKLFYESPELRVNPLRPFEVVAVLSDFIDEETGDNGAGDIF